MKNSLFKITLILISLIFANFVFAEDSGADEIDVLSQDNSKNIPNSDD